MYGFSIVEMKTQEMGKISMEIDGWMNYCQKFTTNPISEWPKTVKILQENMFFEVVLFWKNLPTTTRLLID